MTQYSRKVLSALLFLLVILPLGAERITTPYFELDVPPGLEVQDETSDSSDFQLILQQEGLKRLEEDAFNHYCRVMITIRDSGLYDYTNEDFRKEMESASSSELDELYDVIEEIFGLEEIVSRNKRDDALIDGYYALHINCERKGITEEKGNVIVDGYLLSIGRYMVYISTSYRKKNEEKSLPLIKKALSSLKFTIEEGTLVLYDNTHPGISTFRYKWPEKDPEWTSEYSSGVIDQTLLYDNGEIFMGVEFEYFSSQFTNDAMRRSLKSMSDEYTSAVRKKYGIYNVEITRNELSDRYMYIDYQYTYMNEVIYARIYSRFMDGSKYLNFVSMGFSKDRKVIDEITKSLGFN